MIRTREASRRAEPRRASRSRLRAAGVVLGALSALAPPCAGAGQVPEARDLSRLAQSARAAHVPILLVVSQSFCSYCRRLEREILAPMLTSGEYRERVVVRLLTTDPGASVRDFDGRRVAAADVAARYRAWLTPTLLFLDDRGREIAPRIRGFNTPELYGHYVDAAIEEAGARLRGRD